MINTRSKSHLIYITMVSIFCYMGIYLSLATILTSGNDFNTRIESHILIVTNAILVYFLLLEMKASGKVAVLLSVLYVVSPAHLTTSLFPIYIQAQLAEMFLLSFFLFFIRKKYKVSLILLLIASVLNAKLIIFAAVLIFSKQLKWKEKSLSFIVFLYFLIELYSLYLKQSNYILQNYNAPLFYLESLLIPLNLNFLNLAFFYKNFYPLTLILAFGLLLVMICLLLYSKKSPYLKYLLALLTVHVLSFTIPFKQIFSMELDQYYFVPTLYPTSLVIIIFTFFLISKMMKESVFLILIISIGFFWSSVNISYQKNSSNFLETWNDGMELLGDNVKFEEEIKFKFAEKLLANGKMDAAEIFINANIIKFPKERWYRLLLNIASSRKDKAAVEQVYKLMEERQIPIDL